jgi:hypothetical protein
MQLLEVWGNKTINKVSSLNLDMKSIKKIGEEFMNLAKVRFRQ